VCKLQNGVDFVNALRMAVFHGDPLIRRFNEIIYRVFETGLYMYRISWKINMHNLVDRKITLVQPIDVYYSFNLHRMKPAFYLILMSWFLRVLCYTIELLQNRALSKNVKLLLGGLLRNYLDWCR